MKSFSFQVAGDPKTKGSNVSFVSEKSGRVVTKDGCKGLRQWLEAVGWAAREVYKGPPYTGGVHLGLWFYMPRPRSHYLKSGALRDDAPPAHVVKPDVDKLVRAVLDALTGVVYVDDNQVVSVEATKFYDGACPCLCATVRMA